MAKRLCMTLGLAGILSGCSADVLQIVLAEARDSGSRYRSSASSTDYGRTYSTYSPSSSYSGSSGRSSTSTSTKTKTSSGSGSTSARSSKSSSSDDADDSYGSASASFGAAAID